MKKLPDAPPELTDWQLDAFDRVARSKVAAGLVFAGGAALSAVHLHHRFSEDLDFFSRRELAAADLAPLAKSLRRSGVDADQRTLGPIRTLVLSRAGVDFGKLDFAYFPYAPVDRVVRWRGLRVESLLDHAVNKVQTVLTRFQPRDFVDLYFLLRQGPEPNLERLLSLVRAKFDLGADRLGLAERLLLVREIDSLPRMRLPLSVAELLEFFEKEARALVRRG